MTTLKCQELEIHPGRDTWHCLAAPGEQTWGPCPSGVRSDPKVLQQVPAQGRSGRKIRCRREKKLLCSELKLNTRNILSSQAKGCQAGKVLLR